MNKPRETCNRIANGREWSICCACNGRIHSNDCTTRRNPAKDCCPKRHERLHAEGHTRGLSDTSVPMLPY